MAPPLASSSSAKIARASGVHAASPAFHWPASHVAQLVEAVDRVEDPPHDELRRDDAVPAVLLQAERDVVALLAAEAVELRAEAEGDRLARVASVLADAEAQVLAVADGRGSASSQPSTSSVTPGIAEPERRQPSELRAERRD